MKIPASENRTASTRTENPLTCIIRQKNLHKPLDASNIAYRMGGIYVITMDQRQFEMLPAAFVELGLPKPRITDQGYTFTLGRLRRLRVDLIKPENPDGTYDLWIPPSRAGEQLFEGLKQRGYSDVQQWHDKHRKK